MVQWDKKKSRGSIMERKIAFFDVDNTLVYNDSLFALYGYGCRKWKRYIFVAPAIGVVSLMYFLKILPKERMKELFYTPLNSFDEKDYEEFFEKYLFGRRIEKTFQELLRLKNEGYYILLATASPYAYMRLWKEKGYADEVIGTELLQKGGKYTFKVTGRNCSKEEKKRRIEAFLASEGIEIDYESSVGFSDSDKDIPMLSLCKTRTRVLKDGSHISFVPKKENVK